MRNASAQGKFCPFCPLVCAGPGLDFDLEDFVEGGLEHRMIQQNLKAAVLEHALDYVFCLLAKALLHIFIDFLPVALDLNS